MGEFVSHHKCHPLPRRGAGVLWVDQKRRLSVNRVSLNYSLGWKQIILEPQNHQHGKTAPTILSDPYNTAKTNPLSFQFTSLLSTTVVTNETDTSWSSPIVAAWFQQWGLPVCNKAPVFHGTWMGDIGYSQHLQKKQLKPCIQMWARLTGSKISNGYEINLRQRIGNTEVFFVEW